MNGLVDKFLIDKNRFNGTVMVTGAGAVLGLGGRYSHRFQVAVVALDLSSEDRRRAALLMGEDGLARWIGWQQILQISRH